VTDPTLQTYETAAQRYREQTRQAGPDLLDFLDRLATLAGPGAHVLEIGSGPGNDAVLLEARGLRVTRTDATKAFVAMMQADGFEAALLDVRTDDLGGPYDAVLADAVLLHLTRDEFALALRKARAAVACSRSPSRRATATRGRPPSWTCPGTSLLARGATARSPGAYRMVARRDRARPGPRALAVRAVPRNA